MQTAPALPQVLAETLRLLLLTRGLLVRICFLTGAALMGSLVIVPLKLWPLSVILVATLLLVGIPAAAAVLLKASLAAARGLPVTLAGAAADLRNLRYLLLSPFALLWFLALLLCAGGGKGFLVCVALVSPLVFSGIPTALLEPVGLGEIVAHTLARWRFNLLRMVLLYGFLALAAVAACTLLTWGLNLFSPSEVADNTGQATRIAVRGTIGCLFYLLGLFSLPSILLTASFADYWLTFGNSRLPLEISLSTGTGPSVVQGIPGNEP